MAPAIGNKGTWSPLLLFFLVVVELGEGLRVGSRFLLISSPSTSAIYYALVSPSQLALPPEERAVTAATLLIDGNATKCEGSSCDESSDFGLQEPRSLALFEGSRLRSAVLYVADTSAQNVYGYPVTRSTFNFLAAGTQVKVLKNVKVLGLTVDNFGNLLYSTAAGEVGLLKVEDLEACMESGQVPTPVVLLSSSSSASSAKLAGPAGLATDGFFVFIANSGGDANSGTVLKAPEIFPWDTAAAANTTNVTNVTQASASSTSGVASDALMLRSIASNTDVSEAVATNLCLARDNIFFTGDTTSLYAVKTGGGTIAEVTTDLQRPQGCAFDEAGTLYLADEDANVVLSLPGSFATLRPFNRTAPLIQVAGPAGLAVFGSRSTMTRSAASSNFGGRLWALLSAVFVAGVLL